jgi:itaconate CoA-transferase
MMASGLDGITVVDLTQGVSGPFATRLLSQMGARIIKIERPGSGDLIRFWDDIVHGMCSGHAWVNPGKESVALDLKSDAGREVLHKLIVKADILIENFVPGTVDGWGLSYDEVRKLKPDIIYCHISGFGQTGPYADRSALDLIIQGESGLILTNGTPDQPAKLSVSLCDIAGSMYSLTAMLEALYHRERTGEGQNIEVSLLESVLTWTGYFPYMHWYGGRLPQRVGLHHHTMAPYGPYPCADGKSVIVAAGAGHMEQWRKFCQAIGREDMFDDPRFTSNGLRLQNRGDLDAQIVEALSHEPRDFWLNRFHEFGIPTGAMRDLAEALTHPVIEARGFVKEVDSAVGKVKAFDFPPQSTAYASVNKLGPALLGEHTRAVLSEFGYSDSQIDGLSDAGIIGVA